MSPCRHPSILRTVGRPILPRGLSSHSIERMAISASGVAVSLPLVTSTSWNGFVSLYEASSASSDGPASSRTSLIGAPARPVSSSHRQPATPPGTARAAGRSGAVVPFERGAEDLVAAGGPPSQRARVPEDQVAAPTGRHLRRRVLLQLRTGLAVATARLTDEIAIHVRRHLREADLVDTKPLQKRVLDTARVECWRANEVSRRVRGDLAVLESESDVGQRLSSADGRK